MEKANVDLRNAIKEAGLKLYEVAYTYGCNDGNFSRLLRLPLSPEKEMRVRQIISELKEKKEA